MAAKCNIRPNTNRANRVWAAGADLIELCAQRADRRDSRIFRPPARESSCAFQYCDDAIYQDNNDSDYWAPRPGVLILVSASRRKLLQRTRHTVAATAGQDDTCWTWAR